MAPCSRTSLGESSRRVRSIEHVPSLIRLDHVTRVRFYPKPKSGAEQVAQRVAFYVGKEGLKIGEPPLDAPKI